jgi:hypothetical protein
MDLELTFAFDEVVLANALDEKKSTIRRLSVRNEMFGVWGNFIAPPISKMCSLSGFRVLMVSVPCSTK